MVVIVQLESDAVTAETWAEIEVIVVEMPTPRRAWPVR